jgi:diphthine-ammonia ligase
VFNLLQCVACYGHELVCVASLQPEVSGTELDSFMYQTVGLEIVPLIAQCLQVPLISATIKGHSLN